MNTETDIERARRLARTRAWKKRHPTRDRDYSAERRRKEAEDEVARPRFVCAKCGGEFIIPDSDAAQSSRNRAFVMLGGHKVCEVCARARFQRRPDPWATFGNAP